MTVFLLRQCACVCLCVCCVCASSVASFLLQQGGDVDVPADGLAVEAAGEEVTRLVLLVPRCTTNHTPVTLHTNTHTETFTVQFSLSVFKYSLFIGFSLTFRHCYLCFFKEKEDCFQLWGHFLHLLFPEDSPHEQFISLILTILLLRGSLANLTPFMSNSRTCRLSCGKAMILWLADTLILKNNHNQEKIWVKI